MAQLTAPDAPVIIVLFGATGDLAKRMVLPAFYTLAEQKLMPEDYLLIGTGRGEKTDEQFAQHIHDARPEVSTAPDPEEWARFSARVRFAGGGFTVDDPGELVDAVAKARQDHAST